MIIFKPPMSIPKFSYFCSCLFGLLFSIGCSAQFYLDWAKTYGGNGYEISTGISIDSSNNIYVTGNLWTRADFDPGKDTTYLQSTGFGTDVFIQKFDENGDLLWVKSCGGHFHDEGSAIAVSPSGCVYLAGNFVDSADLNPDTGKYIVHSSGSDDIFILKLDPKGKFRWANTIGGPKTEEVHALKLDNNNNVYLCGNYTDTLNISPSGSSHIVESKGLYDGFVQKLDSNGKHLWTIDFGGSGFDLANDLFVDNGDNTWLTGYFSDTLNVNSKKLISKGKEDVLVLKIDPTGKITWAKQIGGIGVDKGVTIAVDQHKNGYISGSFEQFLSLDPKGIAPSVSSYGGKDIFLVKLDSNGNYIWGKPWGGSSVDLPTKLLLPSNGDIVCLGTFLDQVDFDPGSGVASGNSSIGADIFLTTFDSSGIHKGFQQYGGDGDVTLNDVAIITADQILSTGYFHKSIDLDPTNRKFIRTTTGAEDIYLQKLKATCTNTIDSIHAVNCISYLAPSKKTTWTKTGIYYDTLSSSANCDSILIIDLTIVNSLADTLKVSSCVNFQPKGSKTVYKSSGTYVDTVIGHSGCDSLIVFDLVILRPTSNSFRDSSCSKYVLPSGKVVSKSGLYKDTIQNIHGCDSTISINVLINPSYIHSRTVQTCGPFTSPSNRYIWNTSGIYFDTLQTIGTCDSILEFELTVNLFDTFLVESDSMLRSMDSTGNYQWIKCGNSQEEISGATNQYFIPTKTGFYAVVISRNSCTDTSECVKFIVSNLSRNTFDAGITVYPNPFNETFYIKSTRSDFQFELYNSQGQQIQSGNYFMPHDLNISVNQPSGMYYLRLYDHTRKSESYNVRLIKY